MDTARSLLRAVACLGVLAGTVGLAGMQAPHRTASAEVYFDTGYQRFPIRTGQSVDIDRGEVLIVGGGGGGWRTSATRTLATIVLINQSDFGGQHRTHEYRLPITDLPIALPNATVSGIMTPGWLKRSD